MQAGVSWNLVLNKEDNFRKAFDGFDPKIVAAYDDAKLEELMQDAGIIRNRQKLKAAITNAQALTAWLGLREDIIMYEMSTNIEVGR